MPEDIVHAMSSIIRVLVVEDDPLIAAGTGRVLEQAGHEVAYAATGAEALDAIRGNPPHLVLLDRQLPDADGIEVCRRIKGDPGTAGIIVIIASGVRVDADDQIAGFRTGADAYINRPISNVELLLRVQPFIRIIQLGIQVNEELERRRVLEAELEIRVARRTEELETAMGKLENARKAAINLMQDANQARERLASANAALSREVVERTASEERLRESEEKLRAVAEGIPGGIYQFVVRPDGAHVSTFLSDGAALLLECPMAELQDAAAIFERVHPDDRSSLRASIAVSAAAMTQWAWEFRVLTNSGTIKWLRGVSSPRRLKDGSVCWNGVFLDITSRKQADMALRASEAKWRSYIQAAPVGVLIADETGLHLEANPLAEEMLGYGPGELVRTRVHDLPVEEDLEAAGRHFREVQTLGQADGQFRLRRKDGGRIWAAIRAARIAENRFLAVVQDITAQKQMEADLKAAEVRLRAAVAQAHLQRDDLRELQARLAQVQEDERRRLARELHDQVGQRLTALGLQINLLRAEYERLAPGRPAPAFEAARALLEEIAAQTRSVMAELRPPVLDDYGLPAALRWLCDRVAMPAGVVFSVDTVPNHVRMEPPVELGLFRIAQEALTNVVKHARAARVSFGLEVTDGVATLEITDNGIGFACDAARRGANASGMGLALMAERAAGLGGTFGIDSSPEHGTTVRVEVPL